VVSEEQATAIPAPPADTTATPVAAPDVGGQAPPADQAPTAAPAGAAAPANGAGQAPRPSSLPNTGAADASLSWLIVMSAILLALGGWLIRRRSVR